MVQFPHFVEEYIKCGTTHRFDHIELKVAIDPGTKANNDPLGYMIAFICDNTPILSPFVHVAITL